MILISPNRFQFNRSRQFLLYFLLAQVSPLPSYPLQRFLGSQFYLNNRFRTLEAKWPSPPKELLGKFSIFSLGDWFADFGRCPLESDHQLWSSQRYHLHWEFEVKDQLVIQKYYPKSLKDFLFNSLRSINKSSSVIVFVRYWWIKTTSSWSFNVYNVLVNYINELEEQKY